MEKIIDKYLEMTIKAGLNRLPVKIETEMADSNQDKNEEWRIWNPIPSKATDKEISEFEDYIGYKLPDSYNRFLKYKHFYELMISECSFCSHPVNVWRAALTKMIFEGYPREFLIDTGRIPFADWSDWGLLCFDTTIKVQNNDYPIVLWDHEICDEFEIKYKSFEEMIFQLDNEDTR